MGQEYRAVIVGGGQAGLSAAAALRSEGFDGRVTIIGGEPVAPYQRPPLSKGYLAGSVADGDLELRDIAFYQDNEIDLRLGTAVERIDLDSSRVELADGSRSDFDAVILATGALPRALPPAVGGGLEGVFTLRDVGDARRLREELVAGRSMVIVGGGYIGLEVAATASKAGMAVTVLEAAPRILQRVACEETSAEMRRIHQAHGVAIAEDAALDRLMGDERVRAAMLSDGRALPADVVVVAIGVVPHTGLAERAGITVENGVAVDASMRTSHPQVWAIGDCASIEFRSRRQRIESVGNATETAEIAAKSILGHDVAYLPRPWFWSDQFDTRLTIAGHCEGYTAVYVRETDDGRSHWYYRAAELIAVDSIDDSRTHAAARKLISLGNSPDPARVVDPTVDLRELVRG